MPIRLPVKELWAEARNPSPKTFHFEDAKCRLTPVGTAGTKGQYLLVEAAPLDHQKFLSGFGVTPASRFLLVLPREEHAKGFSERKPGRGPRFAVPLDYFPGAIGITRFEPITHGYNVGWVHGIKSKDYQVTPWTARHYGNWFTHSFERIFERAVRTNAQTVQFNATNATPTIKAAFRKAAQQAGLEKISETTLNIGETLGGTPVSLTKLVARRPTAYSV